MFLSCPPGVWGEGVHGVFEICLRSKWISCREAYLFQITRFHMPFLHIIKLSPLIRFGKFHHIVVTFLLSLLSSGTLCPLSRYAEGRIITAFFGFPRIIQHTAMERNDLQREKTQGNRKRTFLSQAGSAASKGLLGLLLIPYPMTKADLGRRSRIGIFFTSLFSDLKRGAKCFVVLLLVMKGKWAVVWQPDIMWWFKYENFTQRLSRSRSRRGMIL